MPIAALFRRGTAMPDSDLKELVSQWNAIQAAFVIPAGTTSTQGKILQDSTGNASASVGRFFINVGGLLVIQATSTTGGFTGITVASGAAVQVACYRQSAGTLAVAAGTTGATIGVAGLPTVPSTAVVYGVIALSMSAGGTFTGGTTALDNTGNTVDFLDVVGPQGMWCVTGQITAVPG